MEGLTRLDEGFVNKVWRLVLNSAGYQTIDCFKNPIDQVDLQTVKLR